MAKDKERSVNPAAQQRKLDKAKALKKGKAEVQARRNEKLARRNPERLQRQVDDLKALEASGDIKPREKQILADIERDLKAIRKARDTLGEKAPQFATNRLKEEGQNRNNVLGKRTHDGERRTPSHAQRHFPEESSGSETGESIRNIPMPRDTPPPMPRAYRNPTQPRNANFEPIGGERRAHDLPPNSTPVQTTYESAPQLRDLKKEAVGRFVPNVVRQKQDAVRGAGGQLLEPEEMDRLEEEGYAATSTAKAPSDPMKEDAEAKRLAEEEVRFLRELEIQDRVQPGPGPEEVRHHRVELEEVDDEDG